MSALPEATPAPLLGHRWVLDLLGRSLLQRHAAHAYLLIGPPQIGKFTTALAMAQLLLCETSRGCGECRPCRLAARRAHPDLHILEIPPDRKSIPIKDVHEFLHGVALKPLEAMRSVYIIRDAEDLADEGANALLKTLEEPPPDVTLILTAPDPHLLLSTIVSRCQLLTLRPVATEQIADHLVEALAVDPTHADAIARASHGHPGWAILAAQDTALLDARRERTSELLTLLRAGRLERLQEADNLAERWSSHTDEVRDALDVWTDIWRDLWLVQLDLRDRLRNVEQAEELAEVAPRIPAAAIRRALASTLETARILERNANARLALETYLLLLPRVAGGT